MRSPAPSRAVVRAAAVALGLALAFCGVRSAHAQPPTTPTENPSPRGVDGPAGAPDGPSDGATTDPIAPPDPPALTAMARRAAQIEALLDGTLPPSVDPDALLTIDLSDPAFADLHLSDADLVPAPPPPPPLPAQRNKGKRRKRDAPATPPASDDAPPAEAPPLNDGERLRAAIKRVVSTPPEQLRERLRAQRSAFAAHEQQQREAEAEATLAEARLEQAQKLSALLDGALPTDAEAGGLMRVDLGVLARGGAAEPSDGEGDGETDPAPEQTQIAAESAGSDQRARLQAALDRLLTMAPEVRTKTVQAHLQAQQDEAQAAVEEQSHEVVAQEEAVAAAEQAARLRREALEDAARARSELERARAEELARMRGVQEELANYAASLEEIPKAVKSRREWVLEYRRHVRDLKSARWDVGYDPAEADLHYDEIVEKLKASRQGFRDLLERARNPEDGLPDIGEPDEALWTKEGEPLRALHRELVEAHAELLESTRKTVWTALDTTRDDLVALNELRLELLSLASAEHRAAVTGLGPEGVAQARREFVQIGLELSYQALSLPHILDRLRADARVAPIPVFLSVAKLVLALLVFRWWRRRADELIEAFRQRWNDVRPQTRLTRTLSAAAWYLQRVRGPMEWFLLGVVLVSLPDPRYLPEISVLRRVVVWVLGGAAVIRLVEAIASREDVRTGRPEALAELRQKSLTLVGWIAIGVGLSLSVALDLVGAGAIYNWLSGAAWIVALPLIGKLVVWWKPTVYDRVRQEAGEGAFRRWVLDREGTWLAYPVALVAGAFILARQVGRAVVRQASGAEATRRLLAYLFRREVAKRADAAAEHTLAPLPPELLQQISDVDVLVDDYASEELEGLAAVADTPKATLSVVIGARGGGKTRFLERLADEIEARVVTIRISRDPGDSLVTQIQKELRDAEVELTSGDMDADSRTVVLVDNVHLCVQPSVGGMAQLDAFVDFAREAAGAISWVITVSKPSWQYISRARGDKLFLDQVITLPRWSEEQIRALAMGKVTGAGLDPSFEDLVVPRQFDDRDYDEAERTRVGYFRILWDASGGNPAVAMHFWRRSLRLGDDDRPHVRLFVEPSPRDLERVNFNALFVLRAILQMEWASSDQLIECTRLGRADVLEALRYCRSRGYLEHRGAYHRIALNWHQPITRLLGRQHLLVA